MSWPVNEGVGVQLAFGLEGSAVYQLDSKDAKILFAKDREPLITMHSIQEVPTVLNPPQITDDVQLHSVVDATGFALEDFYIPKSTKELLETESKRFMEKMSYVPTCRQLLDIGYLRFPLKPTGVTMIAYAGGPLGFDFNLSIVGVQEDTRECEFIRTVSVPFPAAIQQVAFYHPAEKNLDEGSHLVLVRSETMIYIIRMDLSARFKLTVEVIHEISFVEKIADVQFDPYNHTRFALLDVNGEVTIWTVENRSQLEVSSELTISMINPAEFSSFKMVRWGINSNYVFLIDRSIIQHYDLQTKKLRTVMVLGTFSTMKDYVRIKDDYAILLTSKEISVLKVSERNLERVISWRHYLSDSDPSLYLSVSDLTNFNDGNALFQCSIISLFSSVVINFQIGMESGLFRWLGDPSFEIVKQGAPLRNFATISFKESDLSDGAKDTISFKSIKEYKTISEIDESFSCLQFRLATTLELVVECFTSAPPSSAVSLEKKIDQDQIQSSDESDGVDKLIGQLSLDKDSQTDEIQNFAHILSSHLTVFVENKFSITENLWHLVESEAIVSQISDLEELESMVQQLIEHFEIQNLSFTKNFAAVPKEFIHADDLTRSVREWLMSMYPGEIKDSMQSIVKLVLSLVTFKMQDTNTNEITSQATEGFPSDIQQILSEWGVELAVEEESQPVYSIPATFEMPSINVSQLTKRQLKSVMPSQMSISASLDSQPSQETLAFSQSQVISTSGRTIKKKKKKRLGGFA